MTGYNYTKRSVCSLHDWLQLHWKKCSPSAWLVTITLKEVSALFMAGTIPLKEVSALCMTGYNYTKRSVHSLHGWLQLH